jgi:hypothetical protein
MKDICNFFHYTPAEHYLYVQHFTWMDSSITAPALLQVLVPAMQGTVLPLPMGSWHIYLSTTLLFLRVVNTVHFRWMISLLCL